ncbi:murein L,D-transpeptidase [Patescibacteria group bacterium]|nr:MAG: murein L,D-transpeptidase [Patescibacteria group bacterium]
MKSFYIVLCCLSSFIHGQLTWASHSTSITIQSVQGDVSFELSNMNDISGISLAIADLGDDDTSEIIIGNGMGLEPRVHVRRQDGSDVGSFLAYAPTLGVGINIAACDLTGDGYNEIIVAPQRGGGPHVRIFDRFGDAIDDGGFFAYGETMRAGINLACGDLTGDDQAELVTLPAAGAGPHVRIWTWNDGAHLFKNFFVFHMDDRSGLVGIIHDTQLILAQQQTTSPIWKTLVIHSSPTTISEETLNIDGLGIESLAFYDDELYLSTSSTATLYNVTRNSTSQLDQDHPVLATDTNQFFIAPGRLLFDGDMAEQKIEIDISDQRLYAFEHGILRNSFLISSGLNNATPLGIHSVLEKVPLVHYAWSYGENDARNYDLGWIPYNLRFYPHIYLHYAPWHNNFGHQMSHGCVNVNLTNIQWLYEWTAVGTPVEIKSS